MREIFRRGLLLLTLIVLLAGCSTPLAISSTPMAISSTPTPPEECQQTAIVAQKEVMQALEGLGFEPHLPQVRAVPHLYALAISPREEIRLVKSLWNERDLNNAEITAVETKIEADSEYSALVSETLGYYKLGLLTLSCTDIRVMVRVLAHEWVHHYLRFSNFSLSLETNDLEEVVAIIGESEITTAIYDKNGWGRLAPRPSKCENKELRPIRERVDVLLAEGKTEEAEAYMEEARLQLCSKGWCPRRLNQAFFASCESYGTGAEGDNPRHRLIRELRDRYPTLKEFLEEIKEVSSNYDFFVLLKEKEVNYPEG